MVGLFWARRLPVGETYTTPIEVDPFGIAPEEKLQLLMEADRGMASVEGITARQSNLIFIKEHKTFANSEGAQVEQNDFTSRAGGCRPRRSAPAKCSAALIPSPTGGCKAALAGSTSCAWTCPGTPSAPPPKPCNF